MLFKLAFDLREKERERVEEKGEKERKGERETAFLTKFYFNPDFRFNLYNQNVRLIRGICKSYVQYFNILHLSVFK